MGSRLANHPSTRMMNPPRTFAQRLDAAAGILAPAVLNLILKRLNETAGEPKRALTVTEKIGVKSVAEAQRMP